MREENILPPIERSRRDFDDKLNSGSLSASNHKFKVIQTAVWTHNGKELIKRDEVTELDRRLSTELKGEKSNLTQYLIGMRRTHDEMIKKAVQKEKETKRLKLEIDSMKREIQIFQQESQVKRKQTEGLQNNFQSVKSKQQISAMAGKTLEQILIRMKKDELFYQIKNNDLQKRVKFLQSAISQSQHKKFHLNQFGALSAIAAQQVKNSYNQCFIKRQKDMEQYEQLMRKKKQFDKKSQQRQKITDQIQAIAASDQNDSNLLRSKKLLMVQLILKNILKYKINSLQSKYQNMKSAFHTIKIKTTIDDPNNLAYGYFKLQQTYLQLIDVVKTHEQHQKSLIKQKQQYQHKLDYLNSQYNQIASSTDQQAKYDDSDDFKLAKSISEKRFQIRLIQQKIFSWIVQNKWKMECLKQKGSLTEKRKFFQTHTRDKIPDYLKEFCEGLVSLTDDLQKTPQNESQISYEQLQNLQSITTRRSQIQLQQLASLKRSSDKGGRKKTIRLI